MTERRSHSPAANALELSRPRPSPTACAGRNRAVLRNLSLTIGQGEAYGLVGESGCGKSTVALTVVRYLPRNGSITRRRDLARRPGCDEAGRRGACGALRAESVSMVYQDPGKALNPSIRIGRQLTEIFELARHHGTGGRRPGRSPC